MTLLIWGPVLLLATISIREVLIHHQDWLSLLVPDARRARLLLNSMLLALGVAAIAVVLGWFGALLSWQWEGFRSSALFWLLIPLVALPPYIHAMAWLSTVAWISNVFRSLGVVLRPLYGWSGSLLVEVATYAPLAFGFAWLGIRSVDVDLIELGRTARTDSQVLWRVILPLSAPTILTAGGMIFVFSVVDYSVPSLLQVHVYAMEIFAEYSASNDPVRAFLLAVPLLLMAVAVVTAVLAPLRNLAMRRTRFHPVWGNSPTWPASFDLLLRISFGIIILVTLLPLTMLITFAGPLRMTLSTWETASGELGYSLLVGVIAGLLSLPVAFPMARILVGSGGEARPWWFFIVAPLAIPASLIGISMIYLTNQTWLRSEILFNLLPSVAYVMRFSPLAALILVAFMRRNDPLLHETAEVFQASTWRRRVFVELPMLAPGLLAASGLVFALSLGELSATLMIVPPGRATLAMRIYNYLHYGASDVVAGLGLLLVAGVLAAGAGFAILGALWGRATAVMESES
jgi:iron(III) transport system permease protein